jgi:hypothetical protein
MTRNTFSKTLGPRLRCSRCRMIQDGDSFVARPSCRVNETGNGRGKTRSCFKVIIG